MSKRAKIDRSCSTEQVSETKEVAKAKVAPATKYDTLILCPSDSSLCLKLGKLQLREVILSGALIKTTSNRRALPEYQINYRQKSERPSMDQVDLDALFANSKNSLHSLGFFSNIQFTSQQLAGIPDWGARLTKLTLSSSDCVRHELQEFKSSSFTGPLFPNLQTLIISVFAHDDYKLIERIVPLPTPDGAACPLKQLTMVDFDDVSELEEGASDLDQLAKLISTLPLTRLHIDGYAFVSRMLNGPISNTLEHLELEPSTYQDDVCGEENPYAATSLVLECPELSKCTNLQQLDLGWRYPSSDTFARILELPVLRNVSMYQNINLLDLGLLAAKKSIAFLSVSRFDEPIIDLDFMSKIATKRDNTKVEFDRELQLFEFIGGSHPLKMYVSA